MINLTSIKQNYNSNIKLLKRNKKYKQLRLTISNSKDTLIKVLYKYYDTLNIKYITTKNKLNLSFKQMLFRYRFYDNKFTLLFKRFFKFISDKQLDSLLYEYIFTIYSYGLLLNIGVSYFGLPISFNNITIFGIWFYFFKEEFYPMILKLLRGVNA